VDHASYIPGRAGRVVVGGWEVGIIGEVAPAVLSHWGITVPCVAFELNLTQVVGYLGGA